ncbi:hypothetical protein P9112_013750 [Eukaryota sp. TZLM1-RC]
MKDIPSKRLITPFIVSESLKVSATVAKIVLRQMAEEGSIKPIELDNLPSDVWIQCFPQNVHEIPNRSLPNLRFCLKKLQHHLVKLYESLDYEVRLGLAKTENPAFGNFLKDNRNSSAAALVTQIPSVDELRSKTMNGF